MKSVCSHLEIVIGCAIVVGRSGEISSEDAKYGGAGYGEMELEVSVRKFVQVAPKNDLLRGKWRSGGGFGQAQ